MSGAVGKTSIDEATWRALVTAAARARDRAYAPYSNYAVGAAVLAQSGTIYAGGNVENASYGLALCAERSAIAQLIAAGERRVTAVAVMTEGPEVGRPCGLCRQTLAEFGDDDLPIGLVIPGDELPRAIDRLGDIFAHPFRGDLVKKR
jgi:cytidine deaminase